MKVHGILVAIFCVGGICGCKEKGPPVREAQTTRQQQSFAAGLKPVKDPVSEKIYAFRLDVRQAYNNRRFDDLDRTAEELRTSKEVFGNGSWKIVQFYAAFECRNSEPESMWQLHDQIHQAWIAAKPDSITARVAYADFLVSYAWRARGSGYADTVTPQGWNLFKSRIAAAHKVLDEARPLKDKDPCWWNVALDIARSQGLERTEYDALVAEAHAFEPRFWGYDVERAFSLLPRWYGKPGEWEAYAEQTAARPDGLGVELYARIVIFLKSYHDNILQESKASWPKTLEGLARMRSAYPESLTILHDTAHLASLAGDWKLAKDTFDQIGDRYVDECWSSADEFVRLRAIATENTRRMEPPAVEQAPPAGKR